MASVERERRLPFPLAWSPAARKRWSPVPAAVREWPWRLLAILGTMAALVPLALWGYQASARPVTLVVDGVPQTLYTHHNLVGSILRQAGLALGPADQVFPPAEAFFQPGQPIVVARAYTCTVEADGQKVQLYGRPRSVLEALARAGVTLQPGDDVYVNSILLPESAYADESALRAILSGQPASRHLASPPPLSRRLEIRIVRAVALHVHDDGVDLELRSTAATLGEALEQGGLRLYRADRVYPPLDTPLGAGMHLYIERACPVQITADGRTFITRTHAQTVAQVLQEEGLELGPLDRVAPPLTATLYPDLSIHIVRVTTLDLTEQSPIPYQHRQEADPSMELDQYYLQPGKEGIRETVTRVTYEDGREVGREFLGERIAQAPVDQVLYYGTKIVIRTLETPYGTIQYWRKFRVLATHYYPATCDKTPDHPEYGITYTGKRATRGIIAVDPRVIPLHTRMYVPGYGLGQAEDIGGKIKGRHIDVCFDDADMGKGLWDTRYVDVYLLLPVPEHFPYVLP